MKIIIKTLTYRILSYSLETIILFIYTKSIELSLSLALIIQVSTTFLYYIYEKIWSRFIEKM
jgi:uncharacterized membrane protein